MQNRYSTQPISITTESRFVPQDSVVFTDIGNEDIVVNISDNHFYSLNETATKIWKLLNRRKTVGEILDVFIREYKCDKNKALQSIKRQIEEFLVNDLIKENLWKKPY